MPKRKKRSRGNGDSLKSSSSVSRTKPIMVEKGRKNVVYDKYGKVVIITSDARIARGFLNDGD